jgi:transposase InsO family protein
LAVILDVFFRTAIGYASSRNLDTKLTLTTLRMAIEHLNPLQGCIHHSGRCVQYASKDYVKKLAFY